MKRTKRVGRSLLLLWISVKKVNTGTFFLLYQEKVIYPCCFGYCTSNVLNYTV